MRRFVNGDCNSSRDADARRSLFSFPSHPGVDMAALLAAEAYNLPIRGYVPLHFTNEQGEFKIPERFRRHLEETSTTASAERTQLNVKEADGVLTLFRGGGDGHHQGRGGEREHATDSRSTLASSCVGGTGGEAVSLGKSSPGTQHGIDYALKLGKRREQLCFVDLSFFLLLPGEETQDDGGDPGGEVGASGEGGLHSEVRRVADWIAKENVQLCAIGGPRESEQRGITQQAERFLRHLFESLSERQMQREGGW